MCKILMLRVLMGKHLPVLLAVMLFHTVSFSQQDHNVKVTPVVADRLLPAEFARLGGIVGHKLEGIPPSVDSTKTWKQSGFILSTFRALNGDPTMDKKALSQTKDAGIDLVEVTWLSSTVKLNAALKTAEDVGIKLIVQDLSTFSAFQNSIIPPFTEETVAKSVLLLKKYKMLEGYYVWDEPYQIDFAKVRRLRDLFKKYDPDRLAFSVILPSYGIYKWDDSSYPRYVDNYLKVVDPEVVSFDYYPFRNNSDSLINNDLWKDLGYIRKKALEYNKPLWFYFQAVAINPGEVIMNLERIRAQMYAALAYGVKGLSYYYTSNNGALLDLDFNKTMLYDDLKILNAEVKNIGNLLFSKHSEKIYHTNIKSGNDALNSHFLDNFQNSDLFKSAPDNLVIGVFGDSSAKKYVLVTNLSHTKDVNGNIELRKTMEITYFDKKDNTEKPISNSLSSLDIKLPAGEAILYILQ